MPYLLAIPEGFPKVEFPADNEPTEERVMLGKLLFHDKRLSKDNTISCASCHRVALAFSDSLRVSSGTGGQPGTRNAPTLANVAYFPYFTREGGVSTLEKQVLVPVQETNELGLNILQIADRLKSDSAYNQLSRAAYGGRNIDYYTITRSIAAFERTLLSGNSPYDQYAFQGKPEALNEAQKRGMALFFSDRTSCSSCHAGFLFTNHAFENNGLYESYTDPGRFRLTQDSSDIARFKVPTLRNIELTAPYMHDGSFRTLGEVVSHYDTGGKGHPHQSRLIRPLGLTSAEKSDLVMFLKSLTDIGFVNNHKFGL